jgi:hypothetical protein
VTEALRDSLFGARHWAAFTPVFNVEGERRAPDEGLLRDRCREFSLRTPFIASHVGTDLYRREGNFRSWISSLKDLARTGRP